MAKTIYEKQRAIYEPDIYLSRKSFSKWLLNSFTYPPLSAVQTRFYKNLLRKGKMHVRKVPEKVIDSVLFVDLRQDEVIVFNENGYKEILLDKPWILEEVLSRLSRPQT